MKNERAGEQECCRVRGFVLFCVIILAAGGLVAMRWLTLFENNQIREAEIASEQARAAAEAAKSIATHQLPRESSRGRGRDGHQ